MQQLVILAGGQGTRLRERLGDLPKPLIDICGIPLLERQILAAKKYGFTKVLILVNYKPEKIINFCQSHNNWGLSIKCINDGLKPLGTAGAILNIKNNLEDEFLVMYGDTMLEVDLDRFIRFHGENKHAAATLFLHPNDHPFDSDLVEVGSEGNITNFYPYPHPNNIFYPNLVNAALYCIRKSALMFWNGPIEEQVDFGKNLFPLMLKNGFLLRGYNSPEYIKDCGTPKRVDKVCEDFRSGKISGASLSNKQKAIFVDRDGTLNLEVHHLKSPDQFRLFPEVASAIERVNKSDYKICVVTNQPVIARGECTQKDLKYIHNKMETELGKSGAYLDRIYLCPHHPDGGYPGEISDLKISCNCRKPNSEMIEMAVEDLNIDLNDSWMIGDTTVDIELARRVRVKSVLVETGYAGMDGKYLVTPDFIVPTFSQAVDFILTSYPVMLANAKRMLTDIPAGAVLLIGGQSRSGKSTIASIFKAAFESEGRTCKVISTDRWLLSSEKRGNAFGEKYSLENLKQFCNLLSAMDGHDKKYNIPFYQKSATSHKEDAEILELKAEDVLILEGVGLPLVDNIISKSIKFYVQINESQRRKRVVNEYMLRGNSLEKSCAIYEGRFREEFPLIEQFSIGSVHISLEQLMGGVIK